MQSQFPTQDTPWSAPRWLFLGLAVLIFLLGLGVRFIDLTDAPFDFNPSRQFRAAGIARGIYYQIFPVGEDWQREAAVNLKGTYVEFEPPIFETLVALTYGITGENLVVARVYAILFWVGVGVVTLLLAREMTNSDGALLALGYVFLLPFGIIASRSFQPDVLMVLWLLLAAWMGYRWAENQTTRNAILTGVFGALAVLTKVFAIYAVAGMMIALVLHVYGFKRMWREKQVWLIAAVMLIPSVGYYLIGLGGDAAAGYFSTWFFSLAHLLLTPEFYARWALWLDELVGLLWLVLSLVGVLFSASRARALLLGFWGGYVVYSLTVPHQTTTHDYYHLMLIPLIALSLAPLGALFIGHLKSLGKVWQTAVVLVVFGALVLPLWITRSTLVAQDYRDAPPYWEAVGAALPVEGKTIALTQQYGHAITYYGWRKVALWPPTSEINLSAERGEPEKNFEIFFDKKTEGIDFFLITTFNQLDQQIFLKDKLYGEYSIYAEGGGYIIFDLRDGE